MKARLYQPRTVAGIWTRQVKDGPERAACKAPPRVKATGRQGDRAAGRQGVKATGRQGDRAAGHCRAGEKEACPQRLAEGMLQAIL